MTRTTITRNWGGKCAPVADVVFDDAPEVATSKAPPTVRVLQVAPWIEPTGLDICLGHWVDWMRHDDRDLGAKGQCGIASGYEQSDLAISPERAKQLSDASEARASREVAMATGAMIDGLARHHKGAIYRRCDIATVWHFPNMDFIRELPIAEKELAIKLSKNSATKCFFG